MTDCFKSLLQLIRAFRHYIKWQFIQNLWAIVDWPPWGKLGSPMAQRPGWWQFYVLFTIKVSRKMYMWGWGLLALLNTYLTDSKNWQRKGNGILISIRLSLKPYTYDLQAKESYHQDRCCMLESQSGRLRLLQILSLCVCVCFTTHSARFTTSTPALCARLWCCGLS